METSKLKIVNTENAPAPVGPYNQAVIANGFMFVSGQIALNPKTGKLVVEGKSETSQVMSNIEAIISRQVALNSNTGTPVTNNIKTETRQVMTNIQSILQAAGLTFSNVVKATIFMTDMDFYKDINEIYAEYFDEKNAPAREAVAVKSLPKGVNVEISVIAVI